MQKRRNHLSILYLFLLLSTPGSAAEKIGLDTFLSQVRQKNQAVQASQLSTAGSLDRSKEGEMILAPVAFANLQFANDKKRNPFFPYTGLVNNTYSLGISKLTDFGLQAKLSYNINYYNYQGIAAPYHEGKPALELTQSLWRNGFGSESRATLQLLEANALANHFSESFKVKSLVAQAEMTYWRLSLARESISIQNEAFNQAQRLYEWSSRRVQLHLADRGDMLQAQAALEVRKLQLQAALDEERSAELAFNSTRGLEAEAVPETLEPVKIENLDKMDVPARAQLRDDVLAAQQLEKAQTANAQISIDKDSPTLDVFASYALNSHQDTVSSAMSESFQTNQPTSAVGVRFSAPLDFGTVGASKEGWKKERASAELNYQRKIFEQDQEWADLVKQFAEAKRRLVLYRSIELAQSRKLENERLRLKQGRTTTYQVLLFEQDFSAAQLSRVQAQGNVLQILSRLKIFGANV